MSFERDVDIMARTVYGEARGQPLDGLLAVANVIMNRVRRPGWWGSTVESVCLAPKQFSTWNDGDPNKAIIEAVKPGNFIFDVCRDIAARVIVGLARDPTGGACWYHSKGVQPQWSVGKTPSVVISDHKFFTDIE